MIKVRVDIMEIAGRPRSAEDMKIAALKAKRLGREEAEANEAARKKGHATAPPRVRTRPKGQGAA